MYTIPIIFLIFFLVLMICNIYLYIKDYAWTIQTNTNKKYTIINIINIVLVITSLCLVGFYFFKIFIQLK